MAGSTGIPAQGGWNAVGTTTQSANTAITLFCQPYPGKRAPGSAPFRYALNADGNPNWQGPNSAVTHISNIAYICGSTAHQVKVMRPKNWTTTSATAAINQAVINIVADPGVYSTNLKYPVLNTTEGVVADNAIAAGDWCVYQLADGTWIFDTVASVSTLAITMTTNIPNVTGGGVLKGAPFFFFGISTDKEPYTGYASTIWYQVVSVNNIIQDQTGNGLIGAKFAGDPLLVQSDNATAAGFFNMLSGFYGDY